MASAGESNSKSGRRKQAKPQRKNVDGEDVAAVGVGSPDNNHNTKSALNGHEEDLNEYLHRSDTAVIFPEAPLEQEKKDFVQPDSPTLPAEEYLIKCSGCGQGFGGFGALREHTEHCPGTESGAFPCAQCGAHFTSKEQADKHELLHSPSAQQVSCKVCSKTFANVYRLQRHMISHDESAVLRKFKCPECDKAFKFKHHLKEHIRIHSGEKPFECANCGKRFSHSGSYSSHMTSKKCLVMNLKVGRGRGSVNSGSLLDKCAAQRMLKRPMNNNNNNNNNSFPPMLQKYDTAAAAAAFFSAVGSRVPGAYSHPALTPGSAGPAPALPPYYFPPMHLGHHANSPINPYKLPPAISQFLEHLTGAAPHQRLPTQLEEDQKPMDVSTHVKEENTGSVNIKVEDPVLNNASLLVKEEKQDEVDMECKTSSTNMEHATESPHRLSPGVNSNNGDLETVKMILETVNATVTKQFLEANMQKLSSTSSGSRCPSVNSLASPSAAPNNSESAADFETEKTASESTTCRNCKKSFTNSSELLHHQCSTSENKMEFKSEGLAAKLEEVVNGKLEEGMSGFSGSDEEDVDVQNSSKDLAAEEEEIEGESTATTDHVAEDGRKVRVRSLIADEQLAVLKSHYMINPRPKKDELSRIAEKIGFPVRVVQVWFQNTRARDRREGRLVQIPYMPVAGSSSFSSASIVPSNQPPQVSLHSLRLSSTYASPLALSNEQPLDLSVKREFHNSTSSTPLSSPLRPPSGAGHSDSGEDINNQNAINLSRKSSSSRSPTPVGVAASHLRNLLPFQQSHYQHSSGSSSDFHRSPSPSFNPHDLLNNGITSGSRLARILAQPPVSSHRLGLTNGSSGCVGLVPMDRLMYNPDLHGASRSPLPLFGLAHENGHACSSSPGSDKRSWKQGLFDGGDTTDEADDSICGTLSHDIDPSLAGDDDASSPMKRSKLPLGLSAVAAKGLPPLGPLDGEPEGQFICDQCDKAFSKQSSLARHKYEHSGQRPHKCDVCTKAFKHKHHLTEHKRLHSGEKPFQCSKCLKRFSHSGSYSQHMNHRYSYCKPYRE